jgi:hypothetical protein
MTTKTEKKSRGCASERVHPQMVGLLLLAAGVGYLAAVLPTSLTWLILIAGVVCGGLARRSLERAIKAAHVCGYEAAHSDHERAMVAALKARGIPVVRIDEEGVEQL